MITDLDDTLKQLLTQEMPIDNGEIDIQFDLPKREWVATLGTRPTINLYLYDVRENLDLRRNTWTVERDGNGQATKRRPPHRIDLSYLITAWTSTVEDEHRLLWRALWALLRHPELPKETLQGGLKNAMLPIPTSVAQPEHMPDGPDLWSVLDNELKACLHLVVTLPLDLAQAISGPVVLTKRIELEQGLGGSGPFQESIQIAGTVRDEEGQPIVGATVRVKGIITTTDGEGHYSFHNLAGGSYTLAVLASGHEPKEVAIAVPDRPDIRACYDVEV